MPDYESRIAQHIVLADDATLARIRRHDSWPNMLAVEAHGKHQEQVLHLYISEGQARHLRNRLTEMLENQTLVVSS